MNRPGNKTRTTKLEGLVIAPENIEEECTEKLLETWLSELKVPTVTSVTFLAARFLPSMKSTLLLSPEQP